MQNHLLCAFVVNFENWRDLRALSGKFLWQESCYPESFRFLWLCLAYGAFGQKGLVCLLDLVYPEGLEDLTDMVGLGGLVSVVCLVSKPNFVSKRLFATIYTIHTSGDVIYEHSRIWPASVSTIHVCQFITNSNARIKTCLTWPTNSCCTLLDKFAK